MATASLVDRDTRIHYSQSHTYLADGLIDFSFTGKAVWTFKDRQRIVWNQEADRSTLLTPDIFTDLPTGGSDALRFYSHVRPEP